MPSPRPPAIGLRSFPSHRKPKAGATIPPRAKELVELMVFGADAAGAMNLKEAATHMGVTVATAAAYLRNPMARAAYMEMIRGVREGEYARNTAALVEIRDQPMLKESAAGARARIESVRALEGDTDLAPGKSATDRSVVPGIVVQIGVRTDRQVDQTIISVGATQPVADIDAA